MTKARLDGLQMLILGGVFFVAIGALMEFFNPLGMTDFEELYYGSRAVTHHCDPYRPDEVAALYRAENGSLPADSGVAHTKRLIIFICSNLPTTLLLTAPLAALPWKAALWLWMILIATAFLFACFLIWRVGADSAPRLHGGLLCLLLVNSGLLLCAGNTAGLAISLSVIAVCCFVEDRFALAGVLCLAVALAMKPHDAGSLWLYFLLTGGVPRKRALQTLAVTAIIGAAAIIWLSNTTPHWLPEYQSNLQAAMSSGGRDYPGPATQGGRGIGQIISLQAVLSLVRDDVRFYNPVAYLVCGVLFLLWCLRTLRARFSPQMAWFAFAAIAPLTMLPFYHRTYDARLLLLAVPACAALWKEHPVLGRWALGLTLAAIVLTGDIFWITFFQITHYSGPSVAFGMIPAPLILLAMGVFFLCVYLRDPAAAKAQPS